MYWFLYWSFAFIVSFAHLKKKSILKQWKTLKFHYFILILIVRNVLSVSACEIVNEKLFFIVSRIYGSHKSYHSKTIKAKMLICQHDSKKNEWKYNQTHSNFKKKKATTKKKFIEKRKSRDDALSDESKHYINNIDENQIEEISSIIKLKKYLIICLQNKEKKRVHTTKKSKKNKNDHRSKKW